MNCFTNTLNMQLFALVLFSLLMFGIAYAMLIHWLGDRKEGYTSLLVVFGVLITLAGVAFLSPFAALLVAAAFIASGIPMIVGNVLGYIIRRERAIQDHRIMAARSIDRIDHDDFTPRPFEESTGG